MKKSSFILFALMAVFSFRGLQAQEKDVLDSRQAVLKIVGIGELKVAPDQAVVNMTVKASDMDFNKTVQKLDQKTDKLRRKLQNAGFRKDEIKTSQLNVQENSHWRNGEQIDSGYMAMQHIELRFMRDPQRIARLLGAFSQENGAEALFHFGFALSDEARQKASEELIRKAILDARSKATTIAKTSGVKLGKIKGIEYGQPAYQPMPLYEQEAMNVRMNGGQSGKGMGDMEIRELEMRDKITLYWEIE